MLVAGIAIVRENAPPGSGAIHQCEGHEKARLAPGSFIAIARRFSARCRAGTG